MAKSDSEILVDLYLRVSELRKDLTVFVNYAFVPAEDTLKALADTEAGLAKAILALGGADEIRAFLDACAEKKKKDREAKAKELEADVLAKDSAKRRMDERKERAAKRKANSSPEIKVEGPATPKPATKPVRKRIKKEL